MKGYLDTCSLCVSLTLGYSTVYIARYYCCKHCSVHFKEIELGSNEQKARSAHGEKLSTELFISNRDIMDRHKAERIRGTMHCQD